MIFCLLLQPGPTWREGTPLEEQGLESHRSYLTDLAQRGSVLAAGPFTSVDGGLILVSATDRSEAERILVEDPAIVDGIFYGDVRAWRPLIDPSARLSGDSPKAKEVRS